MKKRDVLILQQRLASLEGRKFSVKFSYFVAKNKVLIKDEFAALDEARRPDPKFTEYDAQRAKLANEMADKDNMGQPRIENGNFVIIERVEEFKDKLESLKEQYADAIASQEQKAKDFEELLEEEVEYNGPKIDLKDIPEQIEPSVLEILIVAGLIIDTDEQ